MNALRYEAAALLALAPKVSRQAREAVAWICREAVAAAGPGSTRPVTITELPSWEPLKAADPQIQIEAAVYAALATGGPNWFSDWKYYTRAAARHALCGHLLRRNLPYREEHLAPLILKVAGQHRAEGGIPLRPLLGAAERLCRSEPPTGRLKRALTALQASMAREDLSTQTGIALRERVDALLLPSGSKVRSSLPLDSMGSDIRAWLGSWPRERRDAGVRLLEFAFTARKKSRWTRNWLAECERIVGEIGGPLVADRLAALLTEMQPELEWTEPRREVQKGLIWCCLCLGHDAMAPAIGRFAERCFRKVPDFGPRSEMLGQACIETLVAMQGSGIAVSELVRLKTRVKYAFVRDRIDKRLAHIAGKQGRSVHDLEEDALPDFGIGPGGWAEIGIGDARAVIALTTGGVALNWFGADGAPRKSVPASVRRDCKAELNALRRRVGYIRAARSAQVARLEDAWLEDRSWPLSTWRRRFLDHPLRRPLASALIWRFESAAGRLDAMPRAGDFVTASGAPVEPPADATVRLWHPLDAASDEIVAWRRRLLQTAVTQPIKQAHREVYALTGEESRAKTRSSRFAGHILRQSQFRALCRERRWAYDLRGAWDPSDDPRRAVAHHDLAIRLEIDIDEDETGGPDALGVYTHVLTGQITFRNGKGRLMNLADVPPMVFSELLRDVDLFVSVASVANDPGLTNGGPDGRFGDYWRQHALADLSPTAQTRRSVIAELLPQLDIADRLSLTDRFLEVRGNRNAYRIHLGSGNVVIGMDHRVLRVLRGLTAASDYRLWLPFLGDQLLSLILSLAFQLARDDRISDPEILSQILR